MQGQNHPQESGFDAIMTCEWRVECLSVGCGRPIGGIMDTQGVFSYRLGEDKTKHRLLRDGVVCIMHAAQAVA